MLIGPQESPLDANFNMDLEKETGKNWREKAAVSLAFKVVLFLACSVSLTTLAWAQRNAQASGVTYSHHFIVLIDDSGSIAGRGKQKSRDKRGAITAELPNRLFGGIKGLPAFNPAEDRVSVLFFSILEKPSICGDKRAANSVLPKNIFDLRYTGRLRDKADFSNQLASWMSDECYFHGNWSPIVISSLLVLPFLEDNLPKGDLDGQTILIQVTDAEFNSQAKPGHELTAYRQAGLANVRDADQELNRVSSLFSLNVLPNQESSNGVFYLGAEYSSQRIPESAIQYQRNSLLYPQALSSSELRYRLNDQLLGDIQLLSQGPGADFDFKPLWLRVGFQNEKGGPWVIGDQTLPRISETKPVSLNACASPQCEASKNNDRLGIGLFESGLGHVLKVTRSDPSPEPGQIKFSVGFHYDTPIYNHLCVETRELLINVAPAPPTEIPRLFLSPSQLGKAETAAEWQRDEDGVTTQEEAKNRVIAARNLRWLTTAIVLSIVVALAMIVLILRYGQRRFLPQLKWLTAPDVVIDFNRPAASRLLLGTLEIENNQPVPWLGRWLGNVEQPSRPAEISLSYNYFDHSDLEVTPGQPIGFVRGDKEEAELAQELERSTREALSDGKQIHVFMAAEKIHDYQANGNSRTVNRLSDARLTVPLLARAEWNDNHAAVSGTSKLISLRRRLRRLITLERDGNVPRDIQCEVVIKPEEPRKPRVTYTPYQPADGGRLYFEKNTLVQVGSFWFESQATHKFAQPYHWDGYTIQTFQGNRPLSGEPIQLSESAIKVRSYEDVEVPVYIYCDGETIPNPDPLSCEYSFKLVGDFSADSEPGFYNTTLYRDPTVAAIELEIKQPKRRLEVYWTPNESMQLRTMPDGGDANELIKDIDTIFLEPQPIRFDSRNTRWRELVSFEIGNSGTAGRGVVEVDIDTSIRCDQLVRNSIELNSGHELGDLVGVYDRQTPNPKVLITEGESKQSRQIYLDPGVISRIVSARIASDLIAAEIKLNIRVENDEKKVTQRTLRIVIPFSLEQLAGQNWLAIDFGTSAISAALGAGRPDSVMMVPLQTITTQRGRSFAQHDIENPERENSNLLPSWICCNADLRDKSGERNRPGFPGYYSERLPQSGPGDPEYIGLPAVTHEFEEHPGRIIYSLKSWLSKVSPYIPIQVKENGKEVVKPLPLEKMVESGFAALAEGYLLPADYRADQIVIAHPNTFTPRHRELLHTIAYKALGKRNRFGIPLPERVRLISESDAMAYHYCAEQMRGEPRAGVERLLVYDFGAGTLDLSLIRVEWTKETPRYPLKWKVEKRLGVPLAGNHIDEILARLIHHLLSDANLVEAKGFQYRLPIVSRPPLDQKEPGQHRRAIIRLWTQIRQAKHTWSRACRKVLDTGGSWMDCPPLDVRVGSTGDFDVVRDIKGRALNVEKPTDGPGLWLADTGLIYLSIPAALIARDQRLTNFLDFMTESVIREALDCANVLATNVDTVIVSGRGALYPGLREKVWRHFPNAETPDLLVDDTMKSGVVLGAIARQSLSREFIDETDNDVLAPKLGVLINYDDHLVLEDDWDEPIDLTASPTFRLVQVNLKNPNPRVDKKSLRKHFYIDLTDQYFIRDDILGDDKHLYVSKEITNGELAIYLAGKDGENRTPVFTDEGQSAKTVTTPPWPVGNVLLDPQE
jgi:hypothetical protein